MKKELAQCIHDARVQKGLTQPELAEKSGVYLPIVKMIESGRCIPRMEHLMLLAENLDIVKEVLSIIGK